jgi:hypothetical protein
MLLPLLPVMLLQPGFSAAYQLVVGGVVRHIQDTSLPGDSLQGDKVRRLIGL